MISVLKYCSTPLLWIDYLFHYYGNNDSKAIAVVTTWSICTIWKSGTDVLSMSVYRYILHSYHHLCNHFKLILFITISNSGQSRVNQFVTLDENYMTSLMVANLINNHKFFFICSTVWLPVQHTAHTDTWLLVLTRYHYFT